ncbi:MAG: DUF3849 domain-containing protein [Oscillospiraceae bacterium]|nr:DUF3849 domain-containing protein [Oscillospiraceae bacterium]
MASNRDERMNEITERLEKGVQEMFTSERYTQYLKTMSQFHNYSFNNTLLIVAQKPDATHVAGYQAWQKKFNRQVKRGEKGIQIISPAPVKEKEMREKIDKKTGEPILGPDGQPEMEEVVKVIPKFKMATVFDVSQTFGEPLPDLGVEEMTANVDNYESFMRAIEQVSPVPIRFDNISNGAKGYYDNISKEIVIQQGMSESQTLKTAIHETAHAILHDRDFMKDQGIQKDQLTRECEAESVAFTVCQNFGIDTSDYSFPYIASWSSSKELKELRSSMDTIRHTSSDMIDGITETVKTMEREQEWTAIRENETLLFTDSQPRYAIYQIEGDNDYKFMDMEFIQSHDMTVKGSDYDLVYSGKLEPTETLEGIFVKFNTELPRDFAGHSLSVSDVIVTVRDGEVKANYVDSVGFTELPAFVEERTSVFEQKVMDAYEEMEEDFVPIYTRTGAYANEHGELEEYRASKNENIACKEAIEKAISDNFDGMNLNHSAVEPVIEDFGKERVAFVLASTIQVKDWDGRFSQSNKDWAASVPTIAEVNPENDIRTEWAVQSHPAILDGFVDMFRESLENTREVEQVISEKPKIEAIPPVSDRTEPEASLQGKSMADIEETVLSCAQAQIDEMGLHDDVQLHGARVYGSRTREGLYSEQSDIDVAISYSGNIREDDFFNTLHEEGLSVAGISVDINPISTERTGTLEDYLESAEKYLDEKEAEQHERFTVVETSDAFESPYAIYDNKLDEYYHDNSGWMPTFDSLEEAEVALADINQKPVEAEKEPEMKFFVAENMKHPVVGEYYENIGSLQEATALYEQMPDGNKGIGFTLTGDIKSYELMSEGTVNHEAIENNPHLKENPLVQKAVSEIEEYKASQVAEQTKEEETAETKPQEKSVQKERREIPTTDRKESVVQALRDRQAKLKEQETERPKPKTQTHKKGDHEL